MYLMWMQLERQCFSEKLLHDSSLKSYAMKHCLKSFMHVYFRYSGAIVIKDYPVL